MTADDAALEAQFTAEFMALTARDERISLEIRPLDAWVLLGQLQLALRHPENTGLSADRARRLARKLERLIATSPALAEVARRGWRAEYDAKQGDDNA